MNITNINNTIFTANLVLKSEEELSPKVKRWLSEKAESIGTVNDTINITIGKVHDCSRFFSEQGAVGIAGTEHRCKMSATATIGGITSEQDLSWGTASSGLNPEARIYHKIREYLEDLKGQISSL